MEIQDFSHGFDTLLDSFAHSPEFGDAFSNVNVTLDEYEKSQFLTEAQEELALSLYTGRNPFGDGFEQTEELRRYLASLIAEAEIDPEDNPSEVLVGVAGNSRFFALPTDLWFITYESVTISNPGVCNDGASLEVFPVKQDEYHKIKKNPFRGANDRRALRLDLSEGYVEIVSKYAVDKYYVRYLTKLKPILLVDLDDGMELNGVSKAQGCELHESLHQMILEMAVRKALQSKLRSVAKPQTT